MAQEQRASCGCTFDEDWRVIGGCDEIKGLQDFMFHWHFRRAVAEIAARAAQPSATLGAVSIDAKAVLAEAQRRIDGPHAWVASEGTNPQLAFRSGFAQGFIWGREQYGGAGVDWRGYLEQYQHKARLYIGRLLTNRDTDSARRLRREAADDWGAIEREVTTAVAASTASAEAGEDGDAGDSSVDRERRDRADVGSSADASDALTPPAPLDRDKAQYAAWMHEYRNWIDLPDSQYSRVRQGFELGFDAAWALLAGRPAEPMVLRSETCECYLDAAGIHLCHDGLGIREWVIKGEATGPKAYAYELHVVKALRLYPSFASLEHHSPAPGSLAVEAES